jgi:acyl dehydratase
MPNTLITPEVQALIGTETPPERNRFALSEEMAYDLADATEDPNPLYVDWNHAKRSRFCELLCPPLATWKDIAPPIGFFGAGQESHFEVPLPFNSYGLNGGSDWQFLRPAFVGDWITRRFRILDIYEKEGRSGPLVFVVRLETQTNQHGQTVNLAKRVSIHRALAKEEGSSSTQPTANQAVEADRDPPLQSVEVSPPGADGVVSKHDIESGKQRFFEEVSVGDELSSVAKGPMTTTHLVRWAAANGNYARIHWDFPFAQLRQGLTNVVVNGSLKNQYLGQLVVAFAGEEGWFKRFYVQHRGMDYPGDILTAFGRVSNKKEGDGLGYVECQIGLRNSRDEQTASGWATVALPKIGRSLPLVWEPEE